MINLRICAFYSRVIPKNLLPCHYVYHEADNQADHPVLHREEITIKIEGLLCLEESGETPEVYYDFVLLDQKCQ